MPYFTVIDVDAGTRPSGVAVFATGVGVGVPQPVDDPAPLHPSTPAAIVIAKHTAAVDHRWRIVDLPVSD
jgi:hypothetical protein